MNKKNLTLGLLATAGALLTSSCSVCSHQSVADCGRSGEAILLPLETPTIHQVDGTWYMTGKKVTVERSNHPWVRPEQLSNEKRHPERYSLCDEESTPMYAAIPGSLAESLQKGKYTHSDAISFINRKWVEQLPEGKVKTVNLTVNAPDFFRNMSSHRRMQTEQGSYLLANIGEMTADARAIYAYPLAALSCLIIDVPASFLYSPPVQKPQVAQSEEVE